MFVRRLFKIGIILIVLVATWTYMLRADISEQRSSGELEGRGAASQGSRSPKDSPIAPGTQNQQIFEAPDDPCLPPLFKDWQEFSIFSREFSSANEARVRIVIDRVMFSLVLEEIDSEGRTHVVYQTEVGLGNLRSPTPEGSYVINHVYCYPDVIFFTATQDKIPNLYNGFFAPLLSCDDSGKCTRFQDLGIHGFRPEARPDPSSSPETFGAVSAGCVRLPDPCTFKKILLTRTRLAPRKVNERGSYHWLKKPIEVLIVNGYPIDTPHPLFNIFFEGFGKLEEGLRQLLRERRR